MTELTTLAKIEHQKRDILGTLPVLQTPNQDNDNK
jgi:hypothetical protein